jgi:hypothetical protein
MEVRTLGPYHNNGIKSTLKLIMFFVVQHTGFGAAIVYAPEFFSRTELKNHQICGHIG